MATPFDSIRRTTLGLVWLTSIAAGAEAIARQLTRTRLLRLLPADPGWLSLLPLAALAIWLIATRLWPAGTRRRAGLLTATVFATLFASGLALQLQLGARLQSDGFYYFAYLRSLAFDRDVNFMNDYRLIGLGDKPHLFQPTITGHAHSAWTIGPAIVWAPFYGAGHLAATRLQARGRDVAVDGGSYPYRQAVCIAGLAYALLGVWFSIRATRHFFAPQIAVTAAALTIGGSFMLWYSLAEPTMTHAPAMASVAGFVWFWVATHGRRSLGHWIALGAVAGLMTMIRWQSAIFAILPAWEAGTRIWRAWRAGDQATARAVLAGGVAFTMAATVAFVPQMLAWKAIYGHYLAVSPVGPQIRWWDPHLVDVLFSSRNGLVAMSPILYVAAIGLVAFAWRRPAFGVPCLVASAVMVYFNASIQDWWGSAGYGGRRFDGVIVLMIIGLATALDLLRALLSRRPQLAAAGVLAMAIVWNVTFLAAARRGDVTPSAATSFGEAGASQARVLHGWIGHPFSLPANAWFAARNGVSLAAYDLLAPLSFLGDPIRPYGRVDIGTGDDPFVLDGWSAAGRDGDVSFRRASRAGVIVPLNLVDDLDLQIRVRRPGEGAPASMTVDTGQQTFGPLAIGAEWQTVVIPTTRDAWRSGVNRVYLTFTADDRQASTAAPATADVDYVRVQIRQTGAK